MPHAVLTIILFSALGWQSFALAKPDRPEVDWSLCEISQKGPARPEVDTEGGDPGATYLFSDEADLAGGDGADISTLLGNVQVRRGERHISADKVLYNKSLETIDAQGSVQAWDVGQYVTGKSAHMDLASGKYRINDVGYLLTEHHGWGTAKEIALDSHEKTITAKDATYTTCPGAGGLGAEPAEAESKPQDWQLTARKIRLNKVTDRGVARNVAIKFRNVPILYSPYLTFPLSDKRKTGFLMPSFGASDETGTEVTVPFYWNIAPNQDATFAVRGMTGRGTLLRGEYRYLTHLGEGKALLDYLPDDKKYDDKRAAFGFEHTGTIAKKWDTDINFNWVSDKNYFEDMGNSMIASSTRFLEQRADVRYTDDRWWALARVQGYQTVDETIRTKDRPYNRLPQLQFGTQFQEHNRKFNFQVEGEWVHFHRDSENLGAGDDVTGRRFDIMPSVSYPLRTPSTFLVPKLSLRHTEYSLDDTAPGEPDDLERTLPIFSLDGGIFLERTARIGKSAYTQTLEPRIYYLAVPYKDQRDFPVFDTGEYTFNFGKMFRENRFSGTDRQGDANQVTLALTTRLLDEETADEVFRASIGQIRYLRDRKVYLPDADAEDRTADTDSSSEIIAEVAAKAARRWRMIAGLQYNVESSTTTRSKIGLRYQPDRQRVVNVGYRYDNNYNEQASTSFRWPLNKNWGTVGRWVYALPESRTVEAVAGIEYNSCCWAARAVVQRFLNGADKDFNNAFFLQLELKGLAGVGRKTGEFLTEIVPGYQNNF